MPNIKKEYLVILALCTILAALIVIQHIKLTGYATQSSASQSQIFELQETTPLVCSILTKSILTDNICYTKETQKLEITLTRTDEKIPISTLTFNFITRARSTIKYTCENNPVSCATCEILNTGTKTYYFSLAPHEAGKILSLTLAINNCPSQKQRLQQPIKQC